ncbi:membrane protein [Croceivirga lutea]|uniref:hypothetical protein n=1 Tax=Croceivirga lutea TaxID=1775167 RepID=UPI00163B2C00|nr:hypothetical protein [Croceivirga lutea]GGG35977.1 membrane protein [Croceivirga lutea]
MAKKLLIAFMCLSSYGIFAQNGTVSPYSFFGIGDFRDVGTVENQMMGGLRMYADSIHINLRNPAAYSNLRLTTYAAGIGHKEFRLKDANEQQNTSVTNLDYLAIGLPLGKNIGLGFGLLPYSSVGYSLSQTSSNTQGEEIINAFSGEGGLNRVYMSLGFQAAKNLTLGATVNYNFGRFEYTRIQSVEGVQLGTIDDRTSRIQGFDFNYTLNYTPMISDKLKLFSFLGANTQVNLNADNEQSLGSFSLTTGQDIEVIDVDLAAQNLDRTSIRVPTIFTLGLGLGEEKKWFVAGEYSTQKNSEFENAFLQLDNVGYDDASTLSLGGYWIPDYTSFSSFLKRVTYRAGLRYDQTGMVVNGKDINNFGITFGLGFPLTGVGVDRFSNLNVGFELGRRGTTDAQLIEESYFKVNLGLSLNAKWFQKRQID